MVTLPNQVFNAVFNSLGILPQFGKRKNITENQVLGPGQVAQLVRAPSRYAKVVGSIASQGTCKNQPMNTQISGTTNPYFSLSN